MKKVIMIGVVLVSIVALLYIFGGKMGDGGKSIARNISESLKIPSVKPLPEEKDISKLISEIVEAAKKGQILDVPFQIGSTNFQEIREQWGEPNAIDETTVGNFVLYPNQYVTIGLRDSKIFDLRSYNDEIQQIRLVDIKESLGEPSEIRFYKDETYDQDIYIYQVHPTFQLKWILSKPTEVEPNPTVQHISVVSVGDSVANGKWTQLIDEMSIDEKIG